MKDFLKKVLVPWKEWSASMRAITREDVRKSGRIAFLGTLIVAFVYGGVLILTHYLAGGTANQPLVTSIAPAMHRATNLIVVLHEFKGSTNAMMDVLTAIGQVRPNSDVLMCEFPAKTFSNRDCSQIAEEICQKLDALWRSGGYEGIEFVGYSMGALLARKAYVYGWGRVEDLNPDLDGSVTNRPPQAWAAHTTRFVLLAGMNRGWTTRSRPNGMSWGHWLLYKGGKFVGNITGTGKLILQCEAGAPFVANLRMQWLDVYRAQTNHPLVVQLLGDADDLVSREDERDISVSKNFVWVQLSGTGHATAADFQGRPPGLLARLFARKSTRKLWPFYAAERKEKFKRALGNEKEIEVLRRASPEVPSAEDTNVVAGVVVLHGIRDLGTEWTSQFEDALQARFSATFDSGQKLCIYRPTYGYFDMISFLLWPERQAKVRWFMDELTELQAKYPKMTNLSFIGHSHGTYVLVSALKKYKALHLDRAVFAGSVAPQDFDWTSPSLTNRINYVRNYVGSEDWVVAIFPRLFELVHRLVNLTYFDIGSAGFNGFQQPKKMPLVSWTNFMHETKYVVGRHSAAIQPGDTNMIDSIAAFVINRQTIQPRIYKDNPTTLLSQTLRAGTRPYICPFCWLAIVGLLFAIGVYVTWGLKRLLPVFAQWGVALGQRPSVVVSLAWAIYIFCVWSLLHRV